ncbi:MAG: CopG family transcriptional regulator [Gammaproteobacteria bacterium]
MKNVTITLDEKAATWAREHAARKNMSLSRFVGGLLEKTMNESREYERAMREYLTRSPAPLKRARAR